MTRFYFHLATGEDYERDEIGSEHVDANQAYLEAFEAAQQMTLDLIRERRHVGRHRFDICDERGRLIMQVPFAEIVGQRIGPQEAVAVAHRGQALVAEVRDQIITARGELDALWSVLNRL